MLRTAPALILMSTLFFFLLPAVVAAQDRLLDHFIETGERALQQGRPVTAEEMFLAAIKRAEALGPGDPRLIRGLKGLAEAYRAQGKDALAEPLLARVAAAERTAATPVPSSGPTQAPAAAAAHRRAQRYLYGGDATRAIGVWQEALRSHPDDTDMLTALGAVLYESGQRAAAVPHVQRATRLLKEDWTLRLFLGTVLYEAGEESRARDEFRAVIAGTRQRGLLQIASEKLSGQFYRERDDIAKRARVHPAAQLAPSQSWVGELVKMPWAGDSQSLENTDLRLMNIAFVFAGSRVFSTAQQKATAAAGGDYFNLYGSSAGSRSDSREWVHFHAFSYSTNGFLVTLRAWNGTTEERDLARLRNQFGLFDFFLQHVRSQLVPGRQPSEEQLRQKLLAYAAVWRAQYYEAVQPLSEALRLAPDDAHARCELGHVYAKLAGWGDAERELLTDLRYWPDYASAYAHLGVTQFSLGRHSEGIERLKKAIELRPALVNAYFMAALSLAIRGEGGAAEELLAHYREIAPDGADSLRAQMGKYLTR